MTVGEGLPYQENHLVHLVGKGALDQRVFVGTLTDKTGDLLIVSGADGRRTWQVPTSSLETLEVSAKQTRTFGRAIPISMAAFGGFGGLLFAATYEPCTGLCILGPGSEGEAFAWGLVAGALVGLPVGLLWGLRKADVWEEVGLNQGVESPIPFLFRPIDGGAGIGFVIPVGRK
jgi:hypothetical protein